MLFIAVMLASKFHDDTHCDNTLYATVAGLRVEDVNDMEKEFLHLLDWKAFVSVEEYGVYHFLLSQLVLRKDHSPCRESRHRPEVEP